MSEKCLCTQWKLKAYARTYHKKQSKGFEKEMSHPKLLCKFLQDGDNGDSVLMATIGMATTQKIRKLRIYTTRGREKGREEGRKGGRKEEKKGGRKEGGRKGGRKGGREREEGGERMTETGTILVAVEREACNKERKKKKEKKEKSQLHY
ncbi:hypothetical protein llap_7719 [Limosa lapponica baueri]|uniref:Uncharacterized protein n=1 Tax=Limosa lapponica baueri TaxID=1758121 RepID=A0A2I0U7B1_LIMLA|nr:hypothetical protein llap_7719 [Limosa lapponica baueri]